MTQCTPASGAPTKQALTTRLPGRPFQFTEDRSELENCRGGETVRFAWLLASSRILCEAPYTRATLVHSLRDAGKKGDAARISRWESGTSAPPSAAVEHYEKLSRIPHGFLVSIGKELRIVRARTSLPADATALAAAMDPYFDLVEGGGCSGRQWEELSGVLAGNEGLYVPPRLRNEMARTLLVEMMRAYGAEFVFRRLAARQLLESPVHGADLTRIMGSLITEGCGPVDEVIALLAHIPAPHVVDLVLKLLAHGRASIRYAACRPMARLLIDDRLSEQQRRRLEGLLSVLTDDPERDPVALADVAARLPAGSLNRLAAQSSGGERRLLNQVATTGEIAPRQRARAIASTIASTVEETGRRGHEPDLVLRRLVREALFHGHTERRHQAGLILAASPYAGTLNTILVQMLSEAPPGIATQILALIRHLDRYASGEGVVNDVGEALTEPIDPRLLAEFFKLVAGARTELSPAVRAVLGDGLSSDNETVRDAAAHAIGLRGGEALASALLDAGPPVASALRWWSALGPPIHSA